MPRAKRVLVAGTVYHVYNQVARGEHVFRDEAEAREILTMDGVEQYGFLVRATAAALDRYGETASRWISRGTTRRQVDGE